ncbi:MAG: hypothetical protein M3R69_03665, partial [Acidobacteriota bacterium]|nr:hypothetical protein [Acidobacteriota bacterium]
MKIFKRLRPTTLMMAVLLTCLAIAQLTASPRKSKPRQLPSKETTIVASSNSESQQANPFQDLTATMQLLRTEYARIIAKFNALKFECRPSMKLQVDEAIADAIKWKRTVDSLGLLETIDISDLNASEKELIVRDRLSSQGLTGGALEARVRAFNLNDLHNITEAESRLVRISRLHQRGLTERQIADILSGDEAIVRELRPMYQNLDRLIWESLKNAYNKAYECCLCSALEYWPPMMAALFQEMSFISETDAVQVGSVEKNQECSMAVRGKWSGGAGWRGMITYTSKYNYKTSGEKANNISSEEWHTTYDATFYLPGKQDEHGLPIAKVRAVATETTAR